MRCRHVAWEEKAVPRHGACDSKREARQRHPSEDGPTACFAEHLYTLPLHPNAISIGGAMLQSSFSKCLWLSSPTDPADAAAWDSKQTPSQCRNGRNGLQRPIITGTIRGLFPPCLPLTEIQGRCMHSGILRLPASNPLCHFFHVFLHLLHCVALHLLHYL